MDNNLHPRDHSRLNVGQSAHIESVLQSSKGARALGVVIIVLFIGILLSFLLNFGISAFLGTGEQADAYFDGNKHEGIVLSEFADAFYLSEAIRQNIIRVDYFLFGRLHSDDVLLGSESFLFPTYDEKTGYNYVADHLGEFEDKFRPEDYRAGITAITEAYRELGAECMFVIIPNAQTVYPERMPEFMGEQSSNTRLRAVSTHLARNGVKNYLDLTAAMIVAKQHGELYNNTEDSLNSRGAYYAYLSAMQMLPESALEGVTPVKLEKGDLVRRTTVGKELARAAWLEDIIKNRTVSLSTDFEQKYQVLIRHDEYDLVFAKPGYKNDLPSFPRMQFAFASDWDRIIMIDYFSNTFGTTIYRNSLEFNADITKKNDPEYIFFFLHEKDLAMLADGSLLPK